MEGLGSPDPVPCPRLITLGAVANAVMETFLRLLKHLVLHFFTDFAK